MRARILCLGAVLAAAGSGAAALPTPGPVVTLPKFEVKDSRLLPPPESWRYAQVPGFEILSNSSDRTTQRLVRDLQDFSQAVGLVWPALQETSAVPAYLILCGRGGKFAEFAPPQGGALTGAASLALRDREQAALVLDTEDTSLNLVTQADAVADSAGVTSEGVEINTYKELHRQYIHFLLARLSPRPPAWMEEGLAQLFTTMEYSPTRIVFGRVAEPGRLSVAQGMAQRMNAAANAGDGAAAGPDLTAPADDRDFNEALARAHLMPLMEMFAVASDSPTAVNSVQSLWAKQCAAFVHLCLYGEHGKYQKAFFLWSAHLQTQPPSEELFKQCFGRSSYQMLLVLRGYIDFTVSKFMEFKPKDKADRFPQAGPVTLQEATDGQVGRIKGDTLHMAGRDAAANTTLIAAYVRGSRDAELLAALGLEEMVEKKPERARTFLEAALAGGTHRARALSTLARLRLDAALAAHGKTAPAPVLTADELASVLSPLFTARKLPPPMADTYDGIAAAWTSSADQPTAAHLAVLNEGVRLFPRDADLLYEDAALHSRIGDTATAVSLGKLGQRMALDEAGKARFAAFVPAK